MREMAVSLAVLCHARHSVAKLTPIGCTVHAVVNRLCVELVGRVCSCSE